MSNAAKLKKRAAEHEQKKQYDKALALYKQVLDESDEGDEDADVALHNRVGDLLLRLGNTAEALTYYEKAVDLYADRGFLNNAIALCNKILRQSPGRSVIYYKLGKISANKGFKSDAKRNFLEYADRMRKEGRIDESFRALKEFADLCPDQDDIRLMLADQLSREERRGEAIEQLQTLYTKFEEEGRSVEARATIDRMKAIDPAVVPRRSGSTPTQRRNDLVFLDLETGGAGRPTPSVATRQLSDPDMLAFSMHAGNGAAEAAPPAMPLPGFESGAAFDFEPGAAVANESLLDLASPIDVGAPMRASGSQFAIEHASALDGLEQTVLDAGPAVDVLGARPTPTFNGMIEPSALEPTSLGGTGLDLLDLGTALDADAGSAGDTGEDVALLEIDSAPSLGGDLLDLEPAVAAPGAAPPPLDGLDLLVPADDDTTGTPTDGLPLLELDSPAPVAGTDVAVEAPRPSDASELSFVEANDATSLAEPTPPSSAPVADPSETVERATPAAAASEIDVEAQAPEVPLAPSRVDELRARLADAPGDWNLHRSLAEALFEVGSRDEGTALLERALAGLDAAGDLDAGQAVVEELLHLTPDAVRLHQKRVEFAVRSGDRPRLIGAYLELADALFRGGETEKARAVYHRVLELAPDSVRAQAALASFAGPMPTPRYVPQVPAPPEPPRETGIDLGDMLREDEAPKSTRMVVEEHAPTGDEQADFADMLRRFKQGVAENVEDEDYASHYDLGVAFKEMGLLDEAIAQFQRALRGTGQRIRAYEALGQCFVEKSQFQVAATILSRALATGDADDAQLVGVLYLLGHACEQLARDQDALGYYQRVFAVDIEFRDVSDRIAAMERKTK